MAKFVKGLNKDAGKVDQPEGSYRYAKNVLSNETAGAISNEPGTSISSLRVRIAAGQRAIGTIETTTDLIVIFAVDTNGNSSIYLYNSNTDTISTLLNTAPGAAPQAKYGRKTYRKAALPNPASRWPVYRDAKR